MTEANVMDEDWALLRSLLPRGWDELARSTEALKGLRKHKEADAFLRTLLLHLACGYSLRETATRARAAKLADLSDVALLKRLRKSKEWLHALCRRLLEEEAIVRRPAAGLALRLVDATHVQEPGPTGAAWRIHYSLGWPQLTCDHFELTATQGPGTGESLTHFPIRPGEHVVADRGYSNFASVEHVAAAGAAVTVRLNPSAIRLLQRGSDEIFPLQKRLAAVQKTNQIAAWPVRVTGAKSRGSIAGRLCVVRKSQAAAARAKAKAHRKAEMNKRDLQPETLLYAEYVMVFTTAADYSAAQILEIYRMRWQIELLFKRFKQLAQLGHLPKEDEESSKAWLYGKLFVALLTERLIAQAEALSPWGYEVATEPDAEPVA